MIIAKILLWAFVIWGAIKTDRILRKKKKNKDREIRKID